MYSQSIRRASWAHRKYGGERKGKVNKIERGPECFHLSSPFPGISLYSVRALKGRRRGASSRFMRDLFKQYPRRPKTGESNRWASVLERETGRTGRPGARRAKNVPTGHVIHSSAARHARFTLKRYAVRRLRIQFLRLLANAEWGRREKRRAPYPGDDAHQISCE